MTTKKERVEEELHEELPLSEMEDADGVAADARAALEHGRDYVYGSDDDDDVDDDVEFEDED